MYLVHWRLHSRCYLCRKHHLGEPLEQLVQTVSAGCECVCAGREKRSLTITANGLDHLSKDEIKSTLLFEE